MVEKEKLVKVLDAIMPEEGRSVIECITCNGKHIYIKGATYDDDGNLFEIEEHIHPDKNGEYKKPIVMAYILRNK